MLNVQLTDINCLISLVWLGEVEVDSSILTETTNDQSCCCNNKTWLRFWSPRVQNQIDLGDYGEEKLGNDYDSAIILN